MQDVAWSPELHPGWMQEANAFLAEAPDTLDVTDPIPTAPPSLIVEDWFTGYIDRDADLVDDEGISRRQDEVELDEGLVDYLHRFDAKPGVKLTEREELELKLGQMRVDYTLARHAATKENIAHHAMSLKYLQTFREQARAHGFSQPTRALMMELAAIEGVRPSYARVIDAQDRKRNQQLRWEHPLNALRELYEYATT